MAVEGGEHDRYVEAERQEGKKEGGTQGGREITQGQGKREY